MYPYSTSRQSIVGEQPPIRSSPLAPSTDGQNRYGLNALADDR